MKLTIPNVLGNVAMFMSNTITLIYAGRLYDSVNVAVIGLAGTTTRISMSSILFGINSAQDTLTSQAFGASNIRLCGIYLNRGSFVVTIIFLLLALTPSFFAEKIFLALKFDPDVSQLTTKIAGKQFLCKKYHAYDLEAHSARL